MTDAPEKINLTFDGYDRKVLSDFDDFVPNLVLNADYTRADLPPSVKPLEWQPIEAAPKDGTHILLYSENGAKNWLKSSRGMAVDRWNDRFRFWGKFNEQHWPPTHWMPLPDGPSDHPAPSDKDAEIERLREALTPSGSTKAAYIGEFTFSVRRLDEDGDEYSEMIDVPWTTIKEIMVAIAARAALEERG